MAENDNNQQAFDAEDAASQTAASQSTEAAPATAEAAAAPTAQPAPAAEASEQGEGNGKIKMPSGKRHSKRTYIVGGVIAAVIIVAAAFWVWHETPGFCNSVCHTPMDAYVGSYYSDDKGMMVTVHADAGNNCLSCHTPVLSDQITEVMAWTSDSFAMAADGEHLAKNYNFATEEFCARSGCHDMSEVVANTWGFEGNDEKYNPHSSHQDYALDCGDCHKAHETSVLVCNQCHKLTMPEGWEAPSDAA